MKKLILTLVMLLTTLVSNAQIGIVTLEKGSDYVPMNMWYTIHEKDRKNQMYFTTHDEDYAYSVLENVLDDLSIIIGDTLGTDDNNDPYWGNNLDNGFFVTVFYTEEDGFYSITILSEEQ